MMDPNNIIESGGFFFIHNFDSGNLGHVERVPTELIASSLNSRTNNAETPDYEFNLWTRPDCAGTEFENGNRTWFYFGVQATEPGVLVRLNLINLNKQGKMYNQGMAPVTRTLPGKPHWERIRDRPVHSTDDNTFTLSFKYRTAENLKATTFFAFTYPFSFAELQIALNSIDMKMLPPPIRQSHDDIYYYRECLVYSLEGRRVDLLTISSYHGISEEREERLRHLFPDDQERPFKFKNKKIIFMSARVHPGETPSSFVFNGFLNLLLTRNDPIAAQLRKLYVFKMIPFLNPDGVARGHYRTDTRGVNLNRVYLNPTMAHHPTVYASRALIRYYHFGTEKEDLFEDTKSYTSRSIQNVNESSEALEPKKKKGSSTSTLKGDKREKSNKSTSNKSVITVKQPSVEMRADSKIISVPTVLADQGDDTKLQNQTSQTSQETSQTTILSVKPSLKEVEESSSLLNDNLVRNCLGSNVHISTSDEMNIAGGNPMKPLRESLKNSISLLMESSSTNDGSDITPAESRLNNVRVGWCYTCRAAICSLERRMPGIASMVPSYHPMASYPDPPTSYHTTIEEYREFQRQQTDSLTKRIQKMNDDKPPHDPDDVYFCTNCFKRFVKSEQDEKKVAEIITYSNSVISSGDNGDRPSSGGDLSRGGSTGDTTVRVPIKEEKPKSPVARARKKPPPVAAPPAAPALRPPPIKEQESGLYLYIDLHGHASKKGIFMYGNHFEDVDSCVECMLLPRIMSLNNLHFHFSSCNFTERNMYLKDRRDGMSREGSGRVAVLKATGLIRSYTLECNYNTGRLVNVLPPGARDPATAATTAPSPPKYTPHIFEESPYRRPMNRDVFEEIDPYQVGRSLGASILDLTGAHPNSRIPCSEHRNLGAMKEWLRSHTRTMRPQLTMSRLRPKTASPPRVPLYARSKAKVTDERKENTYVGAKTDERKRSPTRSHDIINVNNMKFGKKNEPVKSTSRTRYLSENEPKPKTLSTKRRNILAIRKPNASKSQLGTALKGKSSQRSVEEAETTRAPPPAPAKLNKRNFPRAVRDKRTSRCRAVPSSSSDDMIGGTWEDVAGGTALATVGRTDSLTLSGKRRPFPNPSPSQLKKIRLKTAI